MAVRMILYQCVMLWCGLFCTVRIAATTRCNATQTRDFNLSIDSHRNNTGHLIAQVKLEHGYNKPLGQMNTGHWELNVDHSTAKCEDAESIVIEAKLSAPPRRPGPNYELVPGLGYYKLHTEGQPWQDARLTCAQEGAHLAIVNSENEAAQMQAILRRYPKLFPDWRNDVIYIGISDLRTEGEWVTIFDQPFSETGYSKWGGGEPSNGTGEHCGYLRRNNFIHDVGCDCTCSFLCEQEL